MTEAQVVELFAQVNERFDLQGPPEVTSNGPTSFVAVNAPSDERALRLVTKMEYAPDIDEGLLNKRRDLEVYADLRTEGALLPEMHPDAFALRMPNGQPGGLITTLTEYLPVAKVSPYQHGRALASIHNASQYTYLSGIPRTNALDRWGVGKALEFLKSVELPFTLGNTALTASHLETMERKYEEGNKLRDELWERGAAHDSPRVVVQEDVHDENIRGKRLRNRTVGMAIDMFPLEYGLAATDFGRPHNDWVHHFNADPADVEAFEEGYKSKIEGGALPYPDELKLAADYTQIRSSLVFTGIAVSNHLAGLPRNKWLWDQGLYRLENIEDRHADWRPMNEQQKQKSNEA
jgi:hypothetical protein